MSPLLIGSVAIAAAAVVIATWRLGRRRTATLLAAVATAVAAAAVPANAATPSNGTVGPASGSSTSWDFAAVGPGVSSAGTVESACVPVYCDAYELQVSLPQDDGTFYASHTATLHIEYTWQSAVDNDMDVFAFAPDGTESGPGTPDDTNANPGIEVLDIQNPASGTWVVESHVGITPVPTTAHAVATLTYSTVSVPPAPTPQAGDPGFSDASPPAGYETADVLARQNAGEPSLGVDWKTGAAMYMAGTQISRVTFDDGASPPKASWTDVTPPQQSVVNEDAILFTDKDTNRTFATGLLVAGSNASYSDDDGATWSPATFPEPHSPDHESVASGPYASPAPATAGATGYPHAVYYCSQNIEQAAGAFCGRSDTGSTIYNPSTEVFGAASPCGSIHGHIKVAPDGTVYLPQNNCTRADGVAGQGMAVSTDNGQTWSYSVVPDSTAKPSNGGTDPSVGVATDGTVYYGYEDGSGHPKIAVSHDRGATWSPSADAGAAWSIQNSKFPEVVAGDGDRAAFAFLGTSSAGDDQSSSFHGTWYLYVSYTYDGGRTWTTVDATPNDPVQRGCIWNGGGSNACRNLLDFNDATLDRDGRVLVAYTDGCKNIDYSYTSLTGMATGITRGPSTCGTNPNAFADTDKVNFDGLARQTCGRGLFAAKDPGFDESCPAVAVTQVSPADGAVGVPNTTRVSTTFDQAVTTWALSLVDPSGRTVKGTATCGTPCVAPVFKPQSRLKNGATYRATVRGANASGSTSKTWSFTIRK